MEMQGCREGGVPVDLALTGSTSAPNTRQIQIQNKYGALLDLKMQ